MEHQNQTPKLAEGAEVVFVPNNGTASGEAYAARVTKVWSDTCVNLQLDVKPPEGVPEAPGSVYVYQGTGDVPSGYYCRLVGDLAEQISGEQPEVPPPAGEQGGEQPEVPSVKANYTREEDMRLLRVLSPSFPTEPVDCHPDSIQRVMRDGREHELRHVDGEVVLQEVQ